MRKLLAARVVFAATGILSMSLAVLAAPPPTATIIPAPQEMRVTGGEYWAKKPPKMEKVDGIPPEGYELSIRPDGMTIRYSVLREHDALPYGARGREGEVQGLSVS